MLVSVRNFEKGSLVGGSVFNVKWEVAIRRFQGGQTPPHLRNSLLSPQERTTSKQCPSLLCSEEQLVLNMTRSV